MSRKKEVVRAIADLNWPGASPFDLIWIAEGAAKEFAKSLRFALQIYPNDQRLIAMAAGELQTTNLTYEDYTQPGDHSEMLSHFISKLGITPQSEDTRPAIETYTQIVEQMPYWQRAMTVFSREEELILIFTAILKAHDWDKLNLSFYKHYLEQHIKFDSGEDGHAYLVKHFPLSEEVLQNFYETRLLLYSVLFPAQVDEITDLIRGWHL